MMLGFEYLKKLTFPDFCVIAIEFDENKRFLQITTDGARIEAGENLGKELGKVRLLFHSWDSIRFRQFDPHLNHWKQLSLDIFEPIEDICDIQCSQNEVILNGFGANSSWWTEYDIKNPKVEVELRD